jgi:hypothetical protein
MSAISTEVLLAAISECVTVVKPGEILAVRLSRDLDDDAVTRMRAQAEQARDEFGFRVVFVEGEEFAIQRDRSAAERTA